MNGSNHILGIGIKEWR